MFGFLNVFAGAAMLRTGQGVDVAAAVLEETDASAFSFTDDAIMWRDRRIEVDQIVDLRSHFAVSFGSCSFREPVDELAALDRSQLAQQS
jgi:hypothetical protein